MDNKKIGYLGVFIGIIFIVILSILKIQLNQMNDQLMNLGSGNCVLESGKCIHERSFLPFGIGIAAIALTLSLGAYLVLFSRTAKSVEKVQENILKNIKAAKTEESKEERFKILLTGLDEDEKKVIQAVKEQDGISQSTLMYRVDLSKTKLSIVLSQLEKKGLIAKVKKGKINNIFMKKAL